MRFSKPGQTFGQIGYEAYRNHTGGISLASGQSIPEWDSLRQDIRDAWDASGAAIATAITESQELTKTSTVGIAKS